MDHGALLCSSGGGKTDIILDCLGVLVFSIRFQSLSPKAHTLLDDFLNLLKLEMGEVTVAFISGIHHLKAFRKLWLLVLFDLACAMILSILGRTCPQAFHY